MLDTFGRPGDLYTALSDLPGPPLTLSDVDARLTALWNDDYSHRDERFKSECEALYLQERNAGTEMAAIAVQLGSFLADLTRRQELAENERRQVGRDEIAAERHQRLLSGADCSWISVEKNGPAFCRINGRLFRMMIQERGSENSGSQS